MNRIVKPGVIVLAAIICVSFFLPWISVESQMIGGLSKVLTGKRQATIDTISGFSVPVMANSSESRFMISIIQIFNPGIQDADKKSFLIWGVPLLAVFLAIVMRFLDKNRWVNLAIGIIGIGIFLGAAYKISTTDLDKLVLKANIAFGLWLVLGSYLLMGLLCLSHFFSLPKKK